MYIERFLAEKKARERTAVVSNDNLVRLAAIRLGAVRIGCELFLEEYRETMKKLETVTEGLGKMPGTPVAGAPVVPQEGNNE